ncbi:alpha-tocopherol transfer protein isoform X3 [Stomoxys calcitrans]|uniref:CRAL-TRIO domain-containing protein n=2 Tax=Stomoxys calcitrans TaxID=35570 RepID=A0A1I8NVM1_STOCA|nr:alpha-tocopherol transfer protein isoform X3 [Stomoxys calcitrans]
MSADVESTQNLILYNYKLRNKYDHIFLKRDPMDEATQEILKVADYLSLPGRTAENYSVTLFRLQEFEPEKFKFTEAVKVLFMIIDCRFVGTEEIDNGDVIIFDMAGYTLKHLAQTSISSLRTVTKYTQEAHSGRVRQIHVINAAPYLDKVLAVVRPFLKGELMKMIHTHLPGSDTPYEFVPRELLPEEYGGNAGKMSDIRQHWINKLKENRDFLMDESRWKMKKPQSGNVDNLSSLEID